MGRNLGLTDHYSAGVVDNPLVEDVEDNDG